MITQHRWSVASVRSGAALLCFFVAVCPRVSAHQPILGYEELRDTIQRGGPALYAAMLGAESAGLESVRASTLPDPTITFAYNPAPIFTARGSQRSQIRVEQPLPYPGKLRLKGERAELSARLEQAAVDNLELDLLHKARQAWVDIRHVERVRQYIATYREQLADFEAAAAEHYRVGSGGQQAILRIQLERTSLGRMELELETQRESAIATLREVLGDEYQFSLTGGPEASEWRVQGPTDSLVAAALRNRPDAEALRVMSRRARIGAEIAHRDFFPDFGVSVTWFDIAEEAIPPTADGRDALAVGISVRVPLWRAGRRATAEQRSLEQSQMQARLDALKLQLQSRVSALVSALKHDDEQQRLIRDALLPQAETTSQAALIAYSTGRGDFLMLLDAQRTLYSLNKGLEEIRTRRARTLAELARVLGQP